MECSKKCVMEACHCSRSLKSNSMKIIDINQKKEKRNEFNSKDCSHYRCNFHNCDCRSSSGCGACTPRCEWHGLPHEGLRKFKPGERRSTFRTHRGFC